MPPRSTTIPIAINTRIQKVNLSPIPSAATFTKAAQATNRSNPPLLPMKSTTARNHQPPPTTQTAATTNPTSKATAKPIPTNTGDLSIICQIISLQL
jgi:hypothetical protein